MTDKHIKIYRLITSFTVEQSKIGWKKFTPIEIQEISDFLDDNCEDRYEFQYDGNVCHWDKGDLEHDIFFITENDIEKIKNWDKIIHEGMDGFTKIDDITEDVLYDRIDTSVFGFFEFEMRYKFFQYRFENLTKDDILDKVLKYGKESLTENEKLFLDDKNMISPIDEL